MASGEISPERWQQIKTILDFGQESAEGSDIPTLGVPEAGDPELLEKAEELRQHEEKVGEFLEEPLWSLAAGTAPDEPPAAGEATQQRIGHYRIERLLGKGGMGTVFLASREDDYEQRVALKLVNWELGHEEVLARFVNERQILARLQHPGIARLLDGGTTAEGMPYFAMEYVEGVRIDRYCEEQSLGLGARLELFRKVCAAVHFAHQNLVVHRDLKTSNILVTEDGEPRLLDFGIAKLLEPGLQRREVATLPGHGPMTPAYASPEQVLNQPITTASDIYALGVLLYRLLTGQPPYRLEGKSYPEMVELVCESEPTRPSLVAASREATPPPELARRRRQLGGDLDAIILKAMRKEPAQRYGSAAELSEDLRNYLVGLPVQARRGTWLYYSGKFLRRNKLALAALLLILAFATTATVLWRQAVEERAVAEAERARGQKVLFFFRDLLRSARPNESRGGTLTMREAVDLAREKIEGDLDDEPEVQAEILGTLGSIYRDWGDVQEATELKAEALDLRRQSDPGDRLELVADLHGLGSAFYKLGRYEEAERYSREALAMGRRLEIGDENLATIVSNRASIVAQRGKAEEAEELHREALKLRRGLFGPDDPRLAASLSGLGNLYRARGELDLAAENFKEALRIRVESPGEETKVAEVLNSLGFTQQLQGKYAAAQASFERALEIFRKVLGNDHPDTAGSKKLLAALLLERGESDRAEEYLAEALAGLRRHWPEGHWAVADAESVWGSLLVVRGRYEEAEGYLLRSYRSIESAAGRGSSLEREALGRVQDLYRAWGKEEELARWEAPATEPAVDAAESVVEDQKKPGRGPG